MVNFKYLTINKNNDIFLSSSGTMFESLSLY